MISCLTSCKQYVSYIYDDNNITSNIYRIAYVTPILWCGCLTLHVALINRMRKALPGAITWHAKLSNPITDWISCNVTFLMLIINSARFFLFLFHFYSTVSNSIPKMSKLQQFYPQLRELSIHHRCFERLIKIRDNVVYLTHRQIKNHLSNGDYWDSCYEFQ